MATYEQAVALPAQTRSERLVRFITRTPLHVALIAIALIWLVPTLGLAITSFRPNSDILSSGWWTAITHWHWTLHNYGAVIHATGMGHAWSTASSSPSPRPCSR
jgi:alpha-glucoside transport system permease protein